MNLVACSYSLADFIDLSKREPPQTGNARAWQSYKGDSFITSRHSSFFNGIQSWREARELFEHGWTSGAEHLKALRQTFDFDLPAAKSRRRVTTVGADGDELRIDRALAGDWDHAWRTSRRVWQSGNTAIDLYTAFGATADCSQEELFFRGVTGLLVADLLEQAGYVVTLTCGNVSLFRKQNFALVSNIVVKESNEPLRIDSLAALACHAGVFRTLGFRLKLEAPVYLGGYGEMGASTSWGSVKELMQANKVWPDTAVIVESVGTRAGVIAEVKRVLSQVESL